MAGKIPKVNVYQHIKFCGNWSNHLRYKEKGKEEYLYSTIYILCISQSAQAWITQFYLQIHHACLSFVSVHQMAPPLTKVRDIQLQLTIYRPRRDERLSWPGWLTYSGRLTYISGHPSATGRAQDRESSPAKDRRSTAVPRNQFSSLMIWFFKIIILLLEMLGQNLPFPIAVAIGVYNSLK